MIELMTVDKYYDKYTGFEHVLKNINLKIDSKDMVAIMGPSGSGKSTLLHIMGFIDKNFTGKYTFMGKEFSGISEDELCKTRNQQIGFVFQNFNLIENISIFENIELPLLYSGRSHSYSKERVLLALKEVGLEGKESFHPRDLSGGQQQRAAIARAIINKPTFILADEPTGALDTTNSKEILELFSLLNKLYGITIIIVSHDPDVLPYCNRVIHLKDGRITENKEL